MVHEEQNIMQGDVNINYSQGEGNHILSHDKHSGN